MLQSIYGPTGTHAPRSRFFHDSTLSTSNSLMQIELLAGG